MRRAAAFAPGFFGLNRPRPDAEMARRAAHPRLRALSAEHADRLAAALDATAEHESLEANAGVLLTPEQRLLQRTSFGPTLADSERMRQLGYTAYLEEQLAYTRLDDSELEGALTDALPTLSMTPGELYFGENFDLTYELPIAAIYRAIYSKRQLFETMVHFWTDHFNIDLGGDAAYFLKHVDEREVIRKHALGKFPDLLKASSKSPAMLTYLSNDSNYADYPNENYGREVMELHSLGADQGYTQIDVREIARCLTGWFVVWEEDAANFGKFKFEPDAHDFGAKRVIGLNIPAGGGVTDAEKVIARLGTHPNTAMHIARKLLIYFWGYEPPQNYVNRVATVFRNTGGDIKAMLRTVLQRSWIEHAPPKLKRPFHYAASAVRATFGALDDPSPLFDHLSDSGHLPYYWSPPNGYPDTRVYWSGFLRNRWNFSLDLSSSDSLGIRIDLDHLLPRNLTPQALTTRINALVANGKLAPVTQNAVRDFLRGGPRTTQRVHEALGLALASPDFQEF
ncbi:MAG TPA: DUF1800 domain-containing protein [Thermoanaerobaculia bacterium]|nr:DUF1800 domain-containing protein [Thermoanaerobaculia bacterium]